MTTWTRIIFFTAAFNIYVLASTSETHSHTEDVESQTSLGHVSNESPEEAAEHTKNSIKKEYTFDEITQIISDREWGRYNSTGRSSIYGFGDNLGKQ